MVRTKDHAMTFFIIRIVRLVCNVENVIVTLVIKEFVQKLIAASSHNVRIEISIILNELLINRRSNYLVYINVAQVIYLKFVMRDGKI